MNRWFVPGFLLVILLALALRLPELSLRPLHNDEAVNAIKFRNLWTANNYRYDPNEFHGPTLPYFTLPFAWLHFSHDFNNFTESTFRAVTVCFGVALLFLLLLLTPELGQAETWWAGLFTAISPAMVFYSRYYIHETLLVFFIALAGTAWWRYGQNGASAWCWLAGVGLGLMWATKETFFFPVVALALAAVCNIVWERVTGRRDLAACIRWPWSAMATASGIAVLVGLLFFSSFFKNPHGIIDAIRTYRPWFHRAEGVSVHVHPWNFYFERLLFYRANGGPIWSEGLIAALGLIGFIAGLVSHRLARIIGFYTVCLTMIYTLVPYKTPWCLIDFWQAMMVLAGVGATALIRLCKPPALRAAMIILLAAATAQLGWQAWRINFASDKGGVPYSDTAKSPYTYSQTTPDILRLLQTVDALAQVSSHGYGTVIEVMSPDSYWPLPWYLRRFKSVGYWDKIPAQPLAPIMIVSAGLHAAFDERPEKTHLMAGYFELRPGVFFELYVNVDLWTKYVKTL